MKRMCRNTSAMSRDLAEVGRDGHFFVPFAGQCDIIFLDEGNGISAGKRQIATADAVDHDSDDVDGGNSTAVIKLDE